MPVKALKTYDGQTVEIADAARWFEDNGYMPYEAAAAVIKDVFNPKREGIRVSPSMMTPGSTCKREVVIQKTMEYDVELMRLWEAMEGTLFHEALSAAGAGGDWEYEVELPQSEQQGLTRWDERTQVYEAEIFTGMWTHGTADKVNREWTELHDFKTARFPKLKKDGTPYDYGVKDEWTIQLNLYRRLMELCRPETRVERIWVWRMYKGSWDRRFTFRKLAIPLLDYGLLEDKVRSHYEQLKGSLILADQAVSQAEREQIIRAMAMDGQGMFGGKKCSEYCAVNKICFDIQGIGLDVSF